MGRPDRRHRPLTALLALASGCAGSAGRGDPAPAAPPSVRVTVQLTDAPVAEALRLIAGSSGASIDVADDVAARVTLDARDQPWDAVVDAIAHVAGLHAARRGDGVRVAAAALPGPPFVPRPVVVQAPTTTPLEPPPRGVEVDVEADDRPLADVLADLGRSVGATIVVEPGLDERVSVSLRGIPWREAVDVLARMCRAEVEERAGVVVVRGMVCGLSLGFTRASLRTVLQLTAAYSCLSIVIGDDVREEVTVDLREGTAERWLETIAAAGGLAIERRGDLLVASRRPGWGEPDLDGQTEEPLDDAPDAPRLRLRARGAPFDVCVTGLAGEAGRDVAVGPGPAALVDVDLDETAMTALRAAATTQGRALTLRGRTIIIGRGVGAGGPVARAPVTVELALPDGRALTVRVQATCVTPEDGKLNPFAIIDGERVVPGGSLRDPESGDERPVRVVHVEDAGVTLRVSGGGDVFVPFP